METCGQPSSYVLQCHDMSDNVNYQNMIKCLALLLTLVIASAASIPLRNGEFKTVPLKANVYTSFEVYVRGNHRGVFIQASPYGCDTPIELFAGNKPNPTEEDHQWRSAGEEVSRSTFLIVDEKGKNFPKTNTYR
jgi:hypothetical protein